MDTFQDFKLLNLSKHGFQSYYDTIYSRDGVNRMWILKNSKRSV